MTAVADIRPSPIAGTPWYSGNPEVLRKQVSGFIRAAELPPLPGAVVAVVAPHAGYRYSGKTAGYAFAAVQGRGPELVVIISPMHQPYPGNILTTAHKAYATPLGPLWVDQPALSALEDELSAGGLDLVRVANDMEHSLEIELPFLQVALTGEYKILPVMLRSQSPQVALALGKAVAKVIKQRGLPLEKVLLVASTDLSHHYPEELARALDGEMLRRLRGFSPDELFNAERTGKGFACGLAAVAAVMWAARDLGADDAEILYRTTSAEATGDRGSVVGYAAAALLKIA